MRTLVVGTGAVGGYFGAKLARHAAVAENGVRPREKWGQTPFSVTFLARGETLRALQAKGIRIESAIEGTELVRPVDAVAAAPGAFDLVLVCVKATDTATAVRGLGAALAPGAIVLSLQNGVESEATIERELGIAPMLRALAHVGVEATAPGVIRHVSGGTIVVGELDGSRSERLERLRRTLTEAGIDVRISDAIRQAKWQKLAWNASFNLVAAISGRPVAAILADPSARRLVETVMAEVEAVAAAQGIAFEPDYVARVLAHTERNLGAVRPSTLQDRDRGRPLEHAALTGAVVRFGEELGVPTPICKTLDALAALLSGG